MPTTSCLSSQWEKAILTPNIPAPAPGQPGALAVQAVKPKHVIPMHFGTYPLLAGTPDQFREALAKHKLADRLILMKPGEDRAF